MLKGLLTLLFFQGVGEAISTFSDAPIPGSVIGMLLLLATLQLKQYLFNDYQPSKYAFFTGLNEAASFLIRWLALLFTPACVGLFFLPNMTLDQWIPVLAVILIATPLTLITTALLMNHLIQLHIKNISDEQS